MSLKKMKKFEKAFAISALSGICCFSIQATEEAKAIFRKKQPQPPQQPYLHTSIPGVRHAKIVGTGSRGISIREVKGVIQDGNGEIDQRNMLLSRIKGKIDINDGEFNRSPTQEFWELLQYEPDKYKRNFDKGVRSHTHIDGKNDIKVRVNVDLYNGELHSAIIKTGGKRHFMNMKTGDYDVTDIASKTQTSSTDKSGDSKPQVPSTSKSEGVVDTSVQSKTSDSKTQDVKSKIQIPSTGESGRDVGTSIQPKTSDSKIQDVRPKTQVSSTSKSGGDVKKVKKKTYSPQVESQQLIDDIYKTKGLNTELLYQAIKNYSGDVQEVNSEKFYKFLGDSGNNMTISVLKNGELSEVSINNKGSKFERAYKEDFWTTNLETYSRGVKIEHKPQVESQKLIDDVHTTKGLNQGLLYKAVKDYTGDVEIDKSEDIYRFSGNDNNRLEITMNKEGKIMGIFIKNGDEIFEKSYGDDGVGDLVFYKYGYFEVPGSKAVIEKPVYKRTNENGQVEYVVPEKDETFTKVLEKGGDMFVHVLSRRDASIYGKIREQKIVEAKNKYGENKRVILESILVNGEKKTVAYQLDDGLWREVTKSDNGVLWLGEVVKYENLLSEVEGKLRKLAKTYARFGAPLVGGATGFSKLFSGLMK